MSQAVNPLAELLRVEIRSGGPIPFSRFMDQALYHPEHGYYEHGEKQPGKEGDFYTSVSVGPAFGRLLAFQFSGWLETLEDQVQIVEAGTHDGQLAADILEWLRDNRPELFARLDYHILEPSKRRRDWQKQTLTPFASSVDWFADWDELAPVRGIIHSNELLDAMPVNRFRWDANREAWAECHVDWQDGQFCWVALTTGGGPSWPGEILNHLPDGFFTETCPVAEQWWRCAAGKLARGRLMTLDYGLSAEELMSPSRDSGTLRAYHRHRLESKLLESPGLRDLTAHVNFSALEETGLASGLETEWLGPQERFLSTAFARLLKINRDAAQDIDSRQFQTLVHPSQMGQSFRVLVQVRSKTGETVP